MTAEERLATAAYRIAGAATDVKKDPLAMVVLAQAIEATAMEYAKARNRPAASPKVPG